MSKRSERLHRQERRELARRDDKFEAASTAPIAIADETRALDALAEIVERKTKTGESVQPRFTSPTSIFSSVIRWALSCMAGEPDPRATFRQWDAWYRDVSKREPFLSGVLSSVVQTDANRGWTLTGGKRQVKKFTDKFHGFDSWVVINGKPVKGSGGGWRSYSSWQSQSYNTTRMGFVSETGKEGRGGPLFTLWSVDPCGVELTGNPSLPLRYYPSAGGMQEWEPDMFLRGKSLVSTDERQLGYGCPAVERCYQLAKVMVAVVSHYQQKLNANTPDAILTGKFIGEEQWEEALRARSESLRSDPNSYLNSIATIMSSGGDMPEFALTMLSSLPDRWDIELWTKILMRGYELAFGYKGEFSWENAGVMGRGNEVQIQHRNATAQGGKDFILSHQEQLQSVLPSTLEFQYEERDVTGEQEDAALKLAKAQVITEITKWLVNTQSVLTTEQVMQLAAQDGIVPEEWTQGEEQVTSTDEDANPEADSERIYRACMAFPDEPIVRYQWPSGKTRILRMTGRRVFYFPKVIERSIGQVVRAYRDALTNWAYEVMGGRMETTDMRRAHKALIRKTAQEVYFEGMREGGIRNPADEADTEDFSRIKEWVTTQVAHADDFAAATGEVRADETKRAGILNRLGLWVSSVDSLGQQGVMSAKSNRPGIWHLGQTEQHCTTCAGLDGKRHRVNWFLTRGYIPRQPGNEMLECGGWNCDCFISDATTGKVLVRFDPAQPRDEQGQWTDTGSNNQYDAGSQNGNIISNLLREYTSDDDADVIQETASDMLSRLQENDPDRFNEDSSEFVNNSLYDWSQDNNLGRSKYFQLAASKEFDIPLSDYSKKVLGVEADTFAASSYRAMLRDSYEETQRWLRSHGIGENYPVTLYRASESRYINSLNSWTPDRDIAEFYAGRNAKSGKRAKVVSITIPSKYIIGTPVTGLGLPSAKEVVVIGAYSDKDVKEVP